MTTRTTGTPPTTPLATDFWTTAARGIDWQRSPQWSLAPVGADGDGWSWFPDGTLNTCENALDRHVASGAGDRLALIYDSPVTGKVARYTYRDLLDLVADFAGALSEQGVTKGDTVVIYMPMVPEAVATMLACARLGAVHSVVFGGFAAPELAKRMDDARPKVVVTASCGVERTRVIPYLPIVDAAMEMVQHKPSARIVLQRREGLADLAPGDLDWHEVAASARPAGCVSMAATDPLYILYTSGTTGRAKGVVRDNGGHAVALTYSMDAIYGCRPGDVFWAASDLGWVVGHSYIVYAPLLAGCTTVLYEGKPTGTPDAGEFWRVIERHGVNTLFTAPTALRAIRGEDPEAELTREADLRSLRQVFLAGERLDEETSRWTSRHLGIPVVDHWWQTEAGWPMAATMLGAGASLPPVGSVGRPVEGWDVQVVDADGHPVPHGTEGSIVVRLPLPPGAATTLWNDAPRYTSSYLEAHPGFYDTGDGGRFDEAGHLYVTGRLDDVLNVAGHRLSSSDMEEALAEHASVVEAAVIGVPDALKGEVPVGLVVLRPDLPGSPDDVVAELLQLVRQRVGAVASLKRVVVVEKLPRTRSGKTLRKALRDVAAGGDNVAPATAEDPDAFVKAAATLVGA